MDDHDPLAQFFPDDPDISLYTVLAVAPSASAGDIRTAYRRLALRHHPDKHAAAAAEAQQAAAARFQQVGFAYAVLGDAARRQRYDDTGRTDEGMERAAGGWEAYFAELFARVSRGTLDALKREYQGSAEETADLCAAYAAAGGAVAGIMERMPHATHGDEARFVEAIGALIGAGTLAALPAWTAGLGDEKARAGRKRAGEREAREAEGLAKELGVWDEFYGSGKEGARRGKGKGKGKGEGTADGGADADGEAALKAVIQSRQKKMGGLFDSLAAKYGAEPEKKGKGKGKKRAQAGGDDDDESPRKKAKAPDIDDEEFARIQQTLLSRKAERTAASTGRPKRTK